MTGYENATIPDGIRTDVAVDSAQREIALAQGLSAFSFGGLRERADDAKRMVGFVVMRGGDLAEARSYAIQSALIRDAMPTNGEFAAAREAVPA